MSRSHPHPEAPKPQMLLHPIKTTVVAVVASALAVLGAVSPAQAAPDPVPFASGVNHVFVAQSAGAGNTILKPVDQTAGGQFVFSDTYDTFGPTGGYQYNGIGFCSYDNLIYAISNQLPTSSSNAPRRTLLQIGENGEVAEVADLSGAGELGRLSTDQTYNQGECVGNTFYVRASEGGFHEGNNRLYAIDISDPSYPVTTITLSSRIPNVADLVYKDGYLWALQGRNQNASGSFVVNTTRLYRITIDPASTTWQVDSWNIGNLNTLLGVSGVFNSQTSFGGQWLMGNGNLGLLNNDGKLIQMKITDPHATTLAGLGISFIGGVQNGPASTGNDATAYWGGPVDLSIGKVANPTVYTVGETITFTFTVRNNNDLATPYSDLSSSRFVVEDQVPNNLQVDESTLAAQGCSLSATNMLTCIYGPLASGAEHTFSFNAVVLAGGGNSITNTATVTGDEADPDLSNNTSSVTIATGALSIDKSAAIATGRDWAFANDVVNYTVVLTNTTDSYYFADANCPGSATCIGQANLWDDISDVLLLGTYNNDFAVNGVPVAVSPDIGGVLRWTGDVGARSSVTITYSVTVRDDITLDVYPRATGDQDMVNTVYSDAVGASCEADPSFVCDSTSTPVSGPVPGFVSQKSVDKTQVSPGEVANYTIILTNNSGVDFDNSIPAVISDELGDILDDADFIAGSASVTSSATGPNPGSLTEPDPGVPTTTLEWSGPLVANETVTITYQVRVRTQATGDGVLRNVVTPDKDPDTEIGGECVTSADCTTSTPIIAPLFHVNKSVTPTTAVPGGVLTYTVVLDNSSTGDFTANNPAVITDDLSDVLADASWLNASFQVSGDSTTYDPSNPRTDTTFAAPAAGNGYQLSWSGPLAAGAAVTITYTVQVNDPVPAGTTLDNAVTPEYDDTTGSGGVCDPASDCETSTPVTPPVFQVTKSVSHTSAKPGDLVEYTITLVNQSGVDFTANNPAVITDNLSDVLDNSALQAASFVVTPGLGVVYDTTNLPPNTTFELPDSGNGYTLTWSGPLDDGVSVTITYRVEVNQDAQATEYLINVVTPEFDQSTGSGGECDPASGCTTNTPIVPDPTPRTNPTYVATKTVSTQQAQLGDLVTYTITLTNNSADDFTVANPASFTDDLAAVLDDATLVQVLTPGASVTGNTLSWSGPLAAGQSTTVQYEVRVNDTLTGDGVMTNQVVPLPSTEGGGSCATPEDCTTDTPIQTGQGLPQTGSFIPQSFSAPSALAEVAMLLLVLPILAWRYRRQEG